MTKLYRVVMVSPRGRSKIRFFTKSALKCCDFDEFVRGQHQVVGMRTDARFIIVDKDVSLN